MWSVVFLVLDLETDFLSLGCLPALAEGLGGKYYRLPEPRAPEVVARVEELITG
jgi:Mg-chelatase subunit ChlD